MAENTAFFGFGKMATGNGLNNTITGNSFSNTLSGLTGNDRLFGLAGNDILLGGDGSDTLDGGTGNDTLEGGEGNDVLNGGVGSDALIGGKGGDTYVIDSLQDAITEAEGDAEVDTAILELSAFDIGANGFKGVERYQVGFNKGVYTGANTADHIVTDSKFSATITTLLGDDVVVHQGGTNRIDLGDGKDKLIVDVLAVTSEPSSFGFAQAGKGFDTLAFQGNWENVDTSSVLKHCIGFERVDLSSADNVKLSLANLFLATPFNLGINDPTARSFFDGKSKNIIIDGGSDDTVDLTGLSGVGFVQTYHTRTISVDGKDITRTSNSFSGGNRVAGPNLIDGNEGAQKYDWIGGHEVVSDGVVSTDYMTVEGRDFGGGINKYYVYHVFNGSTKTDVSLYIDADIVTAQTMII